MTAASRPCPHGNHFAGTRPHPELRQVCATCGGPRILAGAPTSGAEVEPLRAARRAHSRRRAWGLASGLGAVVAAFDGAIALVLWLLHAPWIAALFAAFGAPFALLFVVGLVRRAAFSRELAERIELAFSGAAREVALGSPNPISAAELSKALGASEQQAERWLAQLSVDEVLRSEVTGDGELVYAPARAVPAAGRRIEAQGDRAAAAQPEAEAELEARFAELARREQEQKRG